MYQELPSAQGRVIQASSWVIDGMPAGLAFREGKKGENFGDISPFLLHTVEQESNIGPYKFKMNNQMQKLRQEIYGKDAESYKDPSIIYDKNDIKISQEVFTSGNFYEKSEDYKLGNATNYKEWKAYKSLELEPESDSTIDWVIAD